ncbi:MAG: hypothetical protein ACI9JY_001426, partial [Saprospiraceae bacterium]
VLLFILLAMTNALFAQTVSVSSPLTMRSNTEYELIGNIKGNTLVLEEEGENFKVQCFDKNLQLSWDKEIELDEKSPNLIGILATLKEFSAIYSFKEKGCIILKINKYDAGANLLDSARVKGFGRVFNTPNFKVITSKNKSKLLIYYFDDSKEIHAYSYDLKKMKLLWENILIPDDVVLTRDFHQILVDNGGNMHLIFDKENRRFKQDEHHFEIFEYGPRMGNSIFRYTINMQSHLTFDAYFDYDNLNTQLIAGGLFYKETRGWAEGYFYMKVPAGNPDAHLLEFRLFNEDFVATLRERKVGKVKGIPEAEVQEIVLRRDGGIILIGELSKIQERQTGGGPTNTRSYGAIDYYYDDVFAISVHPDGQEHWKQIMHKKQYSQDDDAAFSSYFLLKTPSALRVIFNDEAKYETTVSEYVLTGKGEADRNAVMSTESQKLRLRFRDAVQVASNELIVMSESRSRLKLVRVTY